MIASDNEDLAPTTSGLGPYSLFAMWMSDVHSIGGYTFAAGLFFLGLEPGWWASRCWWIAVVTSSCCFRPRGQRTASVPVIGRIAFGVAARTSRRWSER